MQRMPCPGFSIAKEAQGMGMDTYHNPLHTPIRQAAQRKALSHSGD